MMNEKEKLISLQQGLKVLKRYSSEKEGKIIDEITPLTIEDENTIVAPEVMAKLTLNKNESEMKFKEGIKR